MEPVLLFAGIDVSKARLDVALHPAPDEFAAPNDEAGIGTVLTTLHHRRPILIVLEAAGGYASPLVRALVVEGLPVIVANPRQVRDFAKAIGQLPKTDRIDARTLARFAEAVRPSLRSRPDEATEALRALLARRRQIVEMLTAEHNRLGQASPSVRQRIHVHIRWLHAELACVDTDLDAAIRQSPIWREQDHLLQSVPGVGPMQSRTLLADLFVALNRIRSLVVTIALGRFAKLRCGGSIPAGASTPTLLSGDLRSTFLHYSIPPVNFDRERARFLPPE